MISANVAIIGAGPIGIELAVALTKANVDYIHFDAAQIAHTISWFTPQTRFFSNSNDLSIAGEKLFTPDQSEPTKEQYINYLYGIVDRFALQINSFEPVRQIQKCDHFILTTSKGEYQTQQVVLATGDSNYARSLVIPGEDLPHVSHYFGDPQQYFRRKVLVVGGRNSAIEAAMRSYYAGAYVSIVYRKTQFNPTYVKSWLIQDIKRRHTESAIDCYFQHDITAIQKDHVELRCNGEIKTVAADVVLLLTGYVQDNTLLEMAGAEFENNRPKLTADMETTVPGLYVIGTASAPNLFITNCHQHVSKVARALKAPKYELLSGLEVLPERSH